MGLGNTILFLSVLPIAIPATILAAVISVPFFVYSAISPNSRETRRARHRVCPNVPDSPESLEFPEFLEEADPPTLDLKEEGDGDPTPIVEHS